MNKKYKLQGLNCPVCCAKIEDEIKHMKGVNSCEINLLNQDMNIDMKYDLTPKIKKIIKSIEPEVNLIYIDDEVLNNKNHHIFNIIKLILGGFIYLLALILNFTVNIYWLHLSLYIISYIILGYDVVFCAIKNIIHGKIFDEHFLMSISTIGAFLIKEFEEGVAVMLFYQIGEFFEDLAVEKSRKNIKSLLNLRPDWVKIEKNNEIITISPKDAKIGEIMIVKPGEKIALDGIIVSGCGDIDTKAITGESLLKKADIGDEILSGCINIDGILKIKITKDYSQSTATKIIDLVENASSKKAPAEKFISKFAKIYTPIVVCLAILISIIPPIFIGNWINWLNKGLIFLVISCPCALVISVPLAFLSGIGCASKHGILIKGGNYLQKIANIDLVVFDKTGTLTKGEFKVTDMICQPNFDKNKLLEYAAKIEQFSNHPIAKTILKEYANDLNCEIRDYKEISGYGVTAYIDNVFIECGNEKLLKNTQNFKKNDEIGTKIYISIDNVYAGCIIINDEIKEDCTNVISVLNKSNIETYMLTGDNNDIASNIAKKLGINHYYSNLLPEDKLNKFEEMSLNHKISAFVGDGINDTPVLARADVGFAMGGLGSDSAIEIADVILMTDEPVKILDAIKISKKTKTIVFVNILFSLFVKTLFMVLGIFGLIGMWEAVFADVGVTILAVLNSMLILKIK